MKHRPFLPSRGSFHEATLALCTPARGWHCLLQRCRLRAPVRLKVGDAAIRVESPGYAAPVGGDIHGGGKRHLLVGQFNQGKIQVFKHLGAEKIRAGQLVAGRREGGRSARGGGDAPAPLHSWWTLTVTDTSTFSPARTPAWTRRWPGCFKSSTASPTGRFGKRKFLKGTDEKPLIIPLNGQPMTENICTRPFAVDWDGDGPPRSGRGQLLRYVLLVQGRGQGQVPAQTRNHQDRRSAVANRGPS